jgi:hypothetical protein
VEGQLLSMKGVLTEEKRIFHQHDRTSCADRRMTFEKLVRKDECTGSGHEADS